MADKAFIGNCIEGMRDELIRISDEIHGLAELSAEEFQSAKLLEDLLEKYGFTVKRGLATQPTAFRAVWTPDGSDVPEGPRTEGAPLRIGFMCEYDALASLQQDNVPYKQGNGCPGHGCEHNLLGVGSAAAGIALKALAEEKKLPVHIVVYGTPAEETLAGKTIMIRDGYFKDVDVVLGWHPQQYNNPGIMKSKAVSAFTMTFHGRAAHACNCPEVGRSALDAAELTNVGVNYLREHVDRDTYMHYCYINGGKRPNIVPEYAKLWYMVRAYTFPQMLAVKERVQRIAQGACMMTDTTVEFEDLGDNHDNIVLFSLARLCRDCMLDVGTPEYTEEELAYAKELAKNMDLEGVTGELNRDVWEVDGRIVKENGSSDLGDVSWVAPTINMNTTCVVNGTPFHSWAITAQGRSSISHKGMLFGAKVLTLMAERLVTEKELYPEIRAEFDEIMARGGVQGQ